MRLLYNALAALAALSTVATTATPPSREAKRVAIGDRVWFDPDSNGDRSWMLADRELVAT